jgi:hypothetical protein
VSVKAMTFVWEHSPYNGNALIVHLALADHSDDQGVCWPSQKYLADKCKVSVRQIRRIIQQMVNDEYLVIEQPSRAGVSNNRYRLLFGKPQDTYVLRSETISAIWPVPRDTAVTCGRGQAGGHPNHQLTINNRQEKNRPPNEAKQLLEKLRKRSG